MTKYYSFGKKITALLLLIVICSPFSVSAENDIQMLTNYFDLLSSYNFESAQYLWAKDCQERSSRFGIQYDNIPLKIDCSSPIIINLDKMRNYLQPPVKNIIHLNPVYYSKLEYSNVVDNKLIKYYYYAYHQGKNSALIYHQDYYARDWPVKETKYFRIHYHPNIEAYINPIALEEADRFIEQMADSLELSPKDLQLFQDKKIEYYYCDDDQTVKEITGHLTKGTFDLPSNDIISAFFPHYHELVHFLINYKLHKLPLYTLPIIQEGIAVYYGGRWGKTPSVLMALGGFLYNEKIIQIDSILPMNAFDNNNGSDIAYPVSGLFTAYLLHNMNLNDYLKLYLNLSGNFTDLVNMPDSAIKATILEATGGTSWDKFIADFDNFVDKKLKEQTNILPGKIKQGQSIIKNTNYNLTENNNWVALIYKSSNDTSSLAGNILFGLNPQLKGMKSSLFQSQYKDSIPFDGYRYGIRFDKNEAGLYDYATNTLLAKYIWSITPSEDYYNKPEKTITFKIKKAVFDSILPTPSDYKLLPK